MKRIALISAILFITIELLAQITVGGQALIFNKKYTGIDYLIIYNGIDNNASLKYNGTFNSINWYKFTDVVNPVTNQDENFNDFLFSIPIRKTILLSEIILSLKIHCLPWLFPYGIRNRLFYS